MYKYMEDDSRYKSAVKDNIYPFIATDFRMFCSNTMNVMRKLIWVERGS